MIATFKTKNPGIRFDIISLFPNSKVSLLISLTKILLQSKAMPIKFQAR